MKVLVTGGRTYDDYEYLSACLNKVQVDLIINGTAKGADQMSTKWAEEKKLPVLMYPALWQKEGMSAGILRNIRMLEEGRPHLVVAFAGGKGTAHMKSVAKAAGVPVWDTAVSSEFTIGEPVAEEVPVLDS